MPVIESANILQKVSAHVQMLLTERLPGWAVYHSFRHTEETVNACRDIGEGMKLAKAELEMVQIAAWFHDTGYTVSVVDHEEHSVEIAQAFLSSREYPSDRIARIGAAIRATKVPQQPSNVMEQVLCDADMAHLGSKRFFEKSNLLRLEIEKRTGGTLNDADWLRTNIDFVSRCQYHTPYARSAFSRRQMKNLAGLQEQLREVLAMTEKEAAKAGLKKEKLEKEKRPERGIETMFRTIPGNHLQLSAMADNKANLMISTNSIIISLVFGLLVSKLDTNPHLMIPTLMLLAVCLVAMIFAILTTRPNITSGVFTREDIEKKRANLLFFGNFHNSSLEDFEWGMREMMKDSEYLYGAMIKDLYFLGIVLGRKYRYLRICYTVFMYGLIISVIAFAVAFMTAPPAVP